VHLVGFAYTMHGPMNVKKVYPSSALILQVGSQRGVWPGL